MKSGGAGCWQVTSCQWHEEAARNCCALNTMPCSDQPSWYLRHLLAPCWGAGLQCLNAHCLTAFSGIQTATAVSCTYKLFLIAEQVLPAFTVQCPHSMGLGLLD